MIPLVGTSDDGASGGVRVGVTGHRSLAQVARLREHVDSVLDRIGAASGADLVAVSSLAEGADRILAERVLARGGSLIALLPMPADEYEADFATARSRREFHDLLAAADRVVVIADPQQAPNQRPAAPEAREAAYERAGLAVLDGSDVLVALWDGQPSRGRGGTAELVAAARARGHRVEVVDVERERA